MRFSAGQPGRQRRQDVTELRHCLGEVGGCPQVGQQSTDVGRGDVLRCRVRGAVRGGGREGLRDLDGVGEDAQDVRAELERVAHADERALRAAPVAHEPLAAHVVGQVAVALGVDLEVDVRGARVPEEEEHA